MNSLLAKLGTPILLGSGVVLCDQLAKRWATSTLSGQPRSNPSIFDGRLSLLYTENRGAAFGVLAGNDALFVLVAAVVVCTMLVSIVWFPARRTATLYSLGLQMGGAAGNMVDRLRNGFVVDFIYLRPLPVFNLADAAILSGACLLAIVWLGPGEKPPETVKAA